MGTFGVGFVQFYWTTVTGEFNKRVGCELGFRGTALSVHSSKYGLLLILTGPILARFHVSLTQ